MPVNVGEDSLTLLLQCAIVGIIFVQGGIVYGFADLELIMKNEGIYADDGSFDVEKYALLASIGTSMTGLSSAAAGPLMDFVGPRATLGISAFVSTMGFLLFGFGVSFIGGFALMAVGGISSLLVGFRVGLLAPSRVSTVMSEKRSVMVAAVSCSFDASSLVFVIFYELYKGTGLGLKFLFSGLAVVCLVFHGVAQVLWSLLQTEQEADAATDSREDRSVDNSRENVVKPDWAPLELSHGGCDEDEGVVSEVPAAASASDESKRAPLLQRVEEGRAGPKGRTFSCENSGDDITGRELHKTDEAQDAAGGAPELRSLEGWTVLQQVCTLEFAFALIYVSIHSTRSTFLLGTAQQQFEQEGDGEHDFLHTRLFAWIVPAGVIFSPLVSWLLGSCGALAGAHVVCGLGLLYGVLACLPLAASIPMSVVFAAFRVSLYAVLADFTGRTFGPATIGTITGILYSVSACFMFLQQPLTVIVQRLCGGSYFWVNVGLVAAIAPVWGLLLCLQRNQAVGVDKKHKGEREREGDASRRALPTAVNASG